MNKYYYDLHVHSCLSPCADDDNTPYNLAGMAALTGTNIMALTDHNTCKNCPAFFSAAKSYGVIPVAGMELTTAEEIHVVCLFEELESALAFSDEVDGRRIKIENRVDIFGRQLILGEEDAVLGEEPHLLSNATTISLEEVPAMVERYGGVCYPAHIDRDSNGIIAVLGTLPETPVFSAVEIRDPEKVEELTERFSLQEKTVVISSDAHYLQDVRDKQNYFLLEDEPYSSALVRRELFKVLRGVK
ncbi:MAG: PHP domain-containing protein [Clostridia bacterium]|nr:PHP domain-containing protein [Clostridia bacterium]